MLRTLDKTGKINLPAALTPSRSSGAPDKIKHLKHDMTPVCVKLSELRPLHINIVSAGKDVLRTIELMGSIGELFLMEPGYLNLMKSIVNTVLEENTPMKKPEKQKQYICIMFLKQSLLWAIWF